MAESSPILKKYAPVLTISAGLGLMPLVTQDSYILGVWTFVLLNILVVIALDLLLGYTGQLSLGHGLFVAIGAYASGLLTAKFGWSGWAAIPVGMIVAALVAFVAAIPTLRLHGYFLAMATLGFPIMFDALVRVTSEWSGGSSGVISIPRLYLGAMPLRDPVAYYYFVLAVVVVALLGIWALAISRTGLKLRAIHADVTAANARGIPVVRQKIAIFVLSAIIASVSGSLYVHNVQFVAPDTFGLNYSLSLVIMLVVGGMGRIWGGILGVVVLSWMPELFRFTATWQPVIYGSILAAIMLFSPSGVAGLIKRRSLFVPEQDIAQDYKPVVASDVVLEVKDIAKRFGGIQAVQGLSLQVRAGEIKSIIGPNGAGKSTALALISGSIPSDHGTISLNGERIDQLPAYKRARAGMARTFQHARLISTLTVYENVVLGASNLGAGEAESIASAVMRELDLYKVASKFPDEVNQYERRLTEIATALAANPNLLMLDEPGAGLSETEIERLGEVLSKERAKGRAIVLVDHIMSLVMKCSDSILVLDAGKPVLDGAPAAVIADPRVRAVYLGERVPDHA